MKTLQIKAQFYDPGQKYIPPSIVFKKGDLILINFDTKPSRFKVLKVNRANKTLDVKVLKDYCQKDPYIKGTVINIGKPIFEGDWCFRVKRGA